MTKLTSKTTTSRGRRRISVSLAESKTLRLYQEGRRLLADADFEDISIAKFAKAGGTSVGAFYVRFSDKDAFLDFVTSHTFLSAQRGFEQVLPSIISHTKPAEALADTLIGQLTGKELVGIIRLAVKRGFSDLRHRQAFDAYREYAADQVIETLPDNFERKKKVALDLAIQASFGILTDAVISGSPSDPLGLSEYRDTIVSLLSKPLTKTKLVKLEPVKSPEQSGVKKI